jgi:tetratricopeptide (TPR) repeat protein
MESKSKLTPAELMDLARSLFDEGVVYYEQGDISHATARFAQSLSVFEQLRMPNYAWIASLLYHLGNISLNEQPASVALGFLKSAARVQQRADKDESGADLLQNMGKAAVRLGNYTLAHQWFEHSEKIYRVLALNDQALDVRQQLERVLKLQDRYASRSSQDDMLRPYEFSIRVNGQVTKKFSVSAIGEIQWSILETKFDQPIVLEFEGWEVICESK